MKVVFAEKDIQVRDYISMMLEASHDGKIFEVSNEEDLLHILDYESDINIALVDLATLNRDHTEVIKKLQEKKISTILFSTDKEDRDHPTVTEILSFHPLNAFMVKPFRDIDFFPHVKKMVDSLSQSDNDIDHSYDRERFRRVELKRFLSFEAITVDIYIQLSIEKYLKLISENEKGAQERILQYQEKGIQYFYIEKKDFEHFSNDYRKIVFDRLEKAMASGDVDHILRSQVSCYEAVIQMARDFGVTETVIKSTEKCFESLSSVTKQTKSLNDLIKKIMEGNDYISEHSLLLSYVVGQICSESPWATDQTMNKLVMAAILHDATIGDPDLARVHDMDHARKVDLNQKQMDKINRHPISAASLVSAGNSLYPDVDVIISQHHEQPDQSGFPMGIGSLKISPLSCIFIIASEYTEYLIKNSKYDHLTLEQLKEKFSEFYGQGNFKKPLEAFLKAF